MIKSLSCVQSTMDWEIPDTAAGTYVNIDGELIPAEKATVSLLDRNFLYSDGVFESIPVSDGKVLVIDRHIDRLFRSMKAMKIEIPLSKETLSDRLVETLEASAMEYGVVRVIVSRGVGPQGIANTNAVIGPIIFVIPQQLSANTFSYDEVTTAKARIVSTTAIRPQATDPRMKSTSYVNNVLAERELVGTEADHAILLDEHGHVAEAHIANVLLFDEDGVFKTPPTTYTLAGITREVLLERARALGIDVEVTTLTPYDLYTSSDLILCSSRFITHITELSGQLLQRSPSERLIELADDFFEYIRTNEFEELDLSE